MNIPLFLIVCQGIILLWINGASSKAVVQIGKSRIIGKQFKFGRNRLINQYLGIRYAEPPVWDLRFKPTVPLKSFPKFYDARYTPPACHQYTETPFPWYFNDTWKSEDCLYVNVWTPPDANPKNLKSVLFIIFSGQFKFGSTTPSFYSGLALSGVGDVIVVTVSYRIGVFGFLYTDTDDAPGNAGLHDILTALKWVNENIQYFGGDPNQITLCGQSSSANIIGRITESPLATGLYSKLIMWSGSPANLQTEFSDIDLDLAKEFAKRVGCATDEQDIRDPEVNRCLKELPAVDLENGEFDMAPKRTGLFYPIYGDAINPTNPRRDVFKGNFDCKPLFIGNVRDEGSLFLTLLDPDYFGFYGEKNAPVTREISEDLTNRLIRLIPDIQAAKGSKDPKLDLESMLNNRTYESAPDDDPYCLRHQTYAGFADIDIVCPTVYYAQQCAEQSNDVYYYYFVHRYSKTPFAEWMGVTHFSDVQFFIGLPLLKPNDYTPAERKLSRQMIGYWTDFMKYGKPDPTWPKYSKDNNVYKVIGGRNGTKPKGKGPHQTNCKRFEYAFANL